MIIEHAKSIGEILDLSRSIAKTWAPLPGEPAEIWFRGQPRSDYALVPGIYRIANEVFNYNEGSMFERFKAKAAPFVDHRIRSDWDWYFLAQHHGLPTRLLDWTASLPASVYFAISKIFETGDRRQYDQARECAIAESIFDDESPCVWLLEAASLNYFSCGSEDDRSVFSVGGPFTSKYLPGVIDNYSTEAQFPLSILPPQNNTRIAAQQGTFTIHGTSKVGIEQVDSDLTAIKLAKIVLDRANLAFIWRDLELMGVDRVSIFPELSSVSYHVCWYSQHVK